MDGGNMQLVNIEIRNILKKKIENVLYTKMK